MTNPNDPARIDQNQSGHLLRNLVLFGRMLRSSGLPVTPTQMLDVVEALKYIHLRRREDFKNTLRTILVNRVEHLALFDRAFDLFWRPHQQNEVLVLELGSLHQNDDQKTEVEKLTNAGSQTEPPAPESPEPLLEPVYTYSAREVLRHKDFADLTPDELAEVKRLMKKMEWQLERRRTRRRVPAGQGAYLDLRRTFRRNLRHGGIPLKLTWRERKFKRRPLVVICDISGSMERYARVLLQFIYTISNGLDKVEAFAFSTRLTRITRQLRQKEIDVALDQVVALCQDWGGGTRIGDALKTFNYRWSRRVLTQGAIVLIISDGWDRGDIDRLKTEMERLQLNAQRLIWLNPLLGSASYEPLTRGIQAALPYIDDFLPVHNLVSLEQLGHLLEQLGERKPVRFRRVFS
ncbi:MAG TPA: VWA domain-containing protein [Anaerolineae bacterium]|nr:VWA domain-containing protein [Anaerolineae bacterium]